MPLWFMYFKLFLEFGQIFGKADVKETMSVYWKTRLWPNCKNDVLLRSQRTFA